MVESFYWNHSGQRRLDSISHWNQLKNELSFLKGRARFQYLADCAALEEFVEGRPYFKYHHFLKRHLWILPTLFKEGMRKARQD